MSKSVNKLVLVAYLKDGRTVHIGPFNTRGLAQEYASRVVDISSYEVEPLLKPFN